MGKPVSHAGARRSARQPEMDRGDNCSAARAWAKFEGVGLTKDGKRVNISISACPIRDADGQITARAAIMRDITARVQAQEARALLASIVDSADDAIFGAAPDGAILSWNKGAEAMYGYPPRSIWESRCPCWCRSGRVERNSPVSRRIGRGETISQCGNRHGERATAARWKFR